MYVLARSNLTEVLLNVEYMMELMDPALQLGEGKSTVSAHGICTLEIIICLTSVFVKVGQQGSGQVLWIMLWPVFSNLKL